MNIGEVLRLVFLWIYLLIPLISIKKNLVRKIRRVNHNKIMEEIIWEY